MIRWAARTLFSVLAGGILVGTAWWAVGDHARQARINELEQEREALQRVVERLKDTRRVANLLVVDQRVRPGSTTAETVVDFLPAGPADARRGAHARRFTIPGTVCFVDALVIRFMDNFVERGDALRGRSLFLFRRIFGEHQRPIDGHPLDEPGAVPVAYRTEGEPGRHERRLWQRFWEFAADPKAAEAAGVRVAQGEAVYQRLRVGQLWELRIRADGGLEMVLVPVNPLVERQLAQPGDDGLNSSTSPRRATATRRAIREARPRSLR
ncbi:MAG: hypothetical protein L6Q92_00620 [Phycisphaerae bacterium]|nr:hypothetical protein [Phycisphaerae bacterium]